MSNYGHYGDRGRDDYRGGGGYDRDRSRSREDHRGGFDRDGGNFHRGGRGGRFYDGGRGGRFGGGRGGRGGFVMAEPRHLANSNFQVVVNYFKLEPLDVGEMEWVQYHVEIRNAKREKRIDPATNKPFDPFQFDYVCHGTKDMDLYKANQIMRRILYELKRHQEIKADIVYDNQGIVYANKRLFTESDGNKGGVNAEEPLSKKGKYGPADEGGYHAPQESSDMWKDYFVKVKRTVDHDDIMADFVKNNYFRVRLKEVCVVPFNMVRDVLEGIVDEQETLARVQHATNIMIRSACFTLLNSFGPSPHRFYFPEAVQEEIFGSMDNRSKNIKELKILYTADKPTVPNVGMEYAVAFCAAGPFVRSDVCVNYFDREFYPEKTRRPRDPETNKARVMLLENEKLLGMPLNVNEEITNPDARRDILSKLRKITFHVRYKRQKQDPKWVERRRASGWSEKRIRNAQVTVRRNQKLTEEKKKKEEKCQFTSIIWAADDPEQYQFEVKPKTPKGEPPSEEPGKMYTVYKYFREIYGITLRYPKMPCVHIGKGEWYPIEFCSQAFDKAKDANSVENVQATLGFFDEYASTKMIDVITKNNNRLANLQGSHASQDALRLFGLRRSTEPTVLQAKILEEPKLNFQNDYPASIRDGSWNLKGAKFPDPANFTGFAIIDLCEPKSCVSYIENLFRQIKILGIKMPENVDLMSLLPNVTVNGRPNDPGEMHSAFQTCIKRAFDFFLYDKLSVFRRNHVWFKTRTLVDGGWKPCLVIPPPPNIESTEVGLIYEDGPTHKLYSNGEAKESRLKIGVLIGNEVGPIVDPFHFRWRERIGHEFFRNDTLTWERCEFGKELYCDPDDNVMQVDRDTDVWPCHFNEPNLSNTDVLSCVLVYLPNDGTQTYNLVKFMSNFVYGVPSQCAVEEKYMKQKNPAQYCANIALKLNAKLMNTFNKSRAWNTCFGELRSLENGIPWVKEVPTMVFGIHISNSLGQHGISVIAATVGLDDGLMQIAHDWKVTTKTDVIPKDVMENIVKTLLGHFFVHRQDFPKRILYYRDGVSDGNFPRIYTQEILGIRQACHDLFLAVLNKECPNHHVCGGNGCICCTPPITCVVCQTQHSIRVVPAQYRTGKQMNVPSGTCVNSTIMAPSAIQLKSTRDVERTVPEGAPVTLFQDANADGYDFILTAQGGLKGTSKPVHYRTIWNENAVWSADSRCTPLTRDQLQLATYHQSFQYATATKAVRTVPVCYYSKRLSNMVMGYINYIRNDEYGIGSVRGQTNSLVKRDLEELEESEKRYERKKKDGSSFERYTYVREDIGDLSEERETIVSAVKSLTQFSFSPFDEKGQLRAPLRPHMCA